VSGFGFSNCFFSDICNAILKTTKMFGLLALILAFAAGVIVGKVLSKDKKM
jgi:hypothetical protein